ncbi:SUMF1/EgtB/PvdO family nonheme iron enzyme [Myxococcota bacterium]|nr:SUMF1/EgtB/PvdO family nonheme iron enzyme [Myxococcota bacterium]
MKNFILTLFFMSILFPSIAHADEIHPGIYVIVDTSGSMLMDVAGTQTHGDGSVDHPSETGMVSRLYQAKNALTTVINSYGDVRWGLARFYQDYSLHAYCVCYNQASVHSSETGAVCHSTTYAFNHDLTGSNDKVCINYDGYNTCDGGEVLVPLGGSLDNILSWVNHTEINPPSGSNPPYTSDPELRGVGGTPLAGSLTDVQTQLSLDIAADPLRGCRPYSVILLTDGEESCSGDPVTAAYNLRSTLNNSEPCTQDSQCDSNSCDTAAGFCQYDVKVYVIAFATAKGPADAIAYAGGTHEAIAASNEDEIVTAMASIIAESIKTEKCDGLDNDCDGDVDEDFPVGDSCDNGLLGECFRAGSYVCSVDQTGVECDAPVISPAAETCNGLDDDCNGLIDDVTGGCPDPGPEMCNNNDDDLDGSILDDGADDPGVGLTCGTNQGVCTQGITKCISGSITCCINDGNPNSCTPVTLPGTETCNNLDDDCDGTTDEGLLQACYPGGYTGCTNSGSWICNGICKTGISVCSTGSWGSCSGAVTPQTEICDNVDNDCDGLTDEGLGSTTCGLGICHHTVQNCISGVPQTCDPFAGAGPESCNNLDDDCDGQIDEGLTQACYEGPGATRMIGVCRDGVNICSAGVWSTTCSGQILPGTETCNNLDDDCDGQIDEGLTQSCYSGPSGTAGNGVCITGTQTCSAGNWGSCAGEVTPSPEVCNNADDDCNGLVDDMGSISCGLGICAKTVPYCISGTLQTCDPFAEAVTETCNGQDDDCDGQIDGISQACYAGTDGCTWNAGTGSYDCDGVCSPGVQVCPVGGSGIWGNCEGSITPTNELCDGYDNDCDGLVDEDLEEYCYPPGSGVETGCIEQGDGTWICEGLCSVGVRQCSGAAWTTCQGVVTPVSEICDGEDNDCDGQIDEDIPGMGQPCGGVGVCAPGTRQCINGVVVCDGGGDPQPGRCDGLDNNCNGLVDEPDEIAEDPDVGAPCGDGEGVCEPGQYECIDGNLICVGAVEPTSEICNGIDDDCNGNIDEGDICPVNEICYNADCRHLCNPEDEHPCAAGYSCIEVTIGEGTENLCYPQLAPCNGVYCASDEVCRDDECVNPCEPDPCENWEMCVVNRYAGQVGHENEPEYRCTDISCSAAGRSCPTGEFCIDHECISDPCRNDPCTYREEYCIRTGCDSAETCTFECAKIPFCNANERWNPETQTCITDLCFEVNCNAPDVCSEGNCVEDPCLSVNCSWPDICSGGSCMTNPCNDVKCPHYANCVVDPYTALGYCTPNYGVWNPPLPGDTMTSTGNGLFGCSSSGSSGNSRMPLSVIFIVGFMFMFRFRLKLRKIPVILPVIILPFLLTACDFEKFQLNTEGNLNIPDVIEPDADIIEDADVVECIPTEEICDGLDNDCNDIIDDYWAPISEGGLGHFSDDIFNCGFCGNICAFNHAQAQCVEGQCVMGPCNTNWYNFDENEENGCEASCVISSGGQEICDGVDNDCNGIVDDYWTDISEGGEGHFSDDPNNCGSCGRVCAFPNGEGGCVDGQCVLSGCTAGYEDADGVPNNGCECIITGADDSTCDGVDNDCNGQIDEDFTQNFCYTGPGCTPNGDGTFSCTGQCSPGLTTCSGGQEFCIGQTGPGFEACDGVDNNCNGQIDEGYDKQNDASNCGSCGNVCNLSNALSVCSGGNCAISACLPGFHNNDGNVLNGCEYPCTVSNGGVERCDDGFDNDCDGQVDEYNSATDVNNCGSCGYSCSANAPPHMTVTGCSAGICQYTCASNYHDFTTSPGCETYCVPSGVEVCDNQDNNCDGQVDEGFNKNTDVNNCGSCGNVCSASAPLHMVVTGCSSGNCQFACATNWHNLDGILTNGCEYNCTFSGAETCNGADDDCDGLVDEDSSGAPLSQNCYSGPGGTAGVGACKAGTQVCTSGAWGSCTGEVLPTTEICDSIDNNCSGSNNETFNLNTDILNCGSCNNSCFASVPDNASVAGCSSGQCVYACASGYHDIDGSLNQSTDTNGCEYPCIATLSAGNEECNGLDDDCDGQIDEVSDLQPPPTGYCKTGGGCGTTVNSACQIFGTEKKWVCQYPSHVELVPGSPNQVAYRESLCDGLDNDCDGSSDEDFLPIKGTACEDEDFGLCKGTGTVGCKSDQTGTECVIDPMTKGTPQTEACDGIDNDCDGLVDETIWNPGTHPNYVSDSISTVSMGSYNVYVYRYEASRPSSTSSSAGSGTSVRSCSKSNVVPWSKVTYAQAQAACAKAGMRLCTGDEWQRSCNNGTSNSYPYGATYNGTTCNGEDYGAATTTRTGQLTGCRNTTLNTYDMSGNLKEWTMHWRGHTADAEDIYTVRGGSFYEQALGLSCTFSSSSYAENSFTDNIGFRCCTTCGNGSVEPDEDCDDGNRINGDGCDYMCASEIGQTCGNGIIEGSEDCDDGNRVSGDGCSASCIYDAYIPVCGDSIVDTGEQCDDGNTTDGDGCSSECQFEALNCGGQVDEYGYEMCSETVAYTTFTGTLLGYADDSSYTLALGFNFPFYGTNYSNINISTNGTIVPYNGTSPGFTTYSNEFLPTTLRATLIAPWWDDLVSVSGGGVYYQAGGSAPNRFMRIKWLTQIYSGGTNTIEFQTVIHENGNIVFSYRDVSVGNTGLDYGASATAGIQGSSTSADGYYLISMYRAIPPLSNNLSVTFYYP